MFSFSVSQMFSALSFPSAQIKKLFLIGSDHLAQMRGFIGGVILPAIHPIRLAGTIAAVSNLIPLIIGLRKYSRLDPGLRLLTINLLIAVIVDIIGYTLMALFEYNQVIYSLYTPAEFIIFVLVFRHWLSHERLKKILTWSIPVYLVLWLGGHSWLLIQGLEEWKNQQLLINDVFLSVESVFFIIFSIATLLNIINDETVPVVRNPVFWVTTAILFYFTGNLFIFAFQRILLVEGSGLLMVWYLHSALNFLKNILFAIGLTIAGKNAVAATQD